MGDPQRARRRWPVLLCAGLALVIAGCPVLPTPTPSRRARKLTEVALTVVYINVRQTLDAQATRVALTPLPGGAGVASPPAGPASPALPTLTPLLLTEQPLTPTPTPTVPLATITPTSTPTPTPTATMPTPPVAALVDAAATLTQAALPSPTPAGPPVLSLGARFTLELARAQARTSAGVFNPRVGRFLVLSGTLTNLSGGRACVYSREIRLEHGGQRYAPFVEAMALVKGDYRVDYPGPVNGQCVEPGGREGTFMLFDTPEDMTTFDFVHNGVRLGTLALVPLEDGTFAVQVAGN
mgnify:CR=1 FL=1